MEKLELSIQNPFITKVTREDRRPTVFHRAFSKLFEEELHPGKIFPIFLKIEDDYKVFGALTLNTGGSVSFFPDFYNLHEFDHLTLNRDFIEKKGHLTKVNLDNNKHKKIAHLEASEMANGYFHLITFFMKNGDLLMDSPSNIELPVIYYQSEEEKQKYITMIEDAVSIGHCILDFPDEPGLYCIQILVYPKGIDKEKLSVCTNVIEDFLHILTPLNKSINTKKIEIDTQENCSFSICLLLFRFIHELDSNHPFGFVIAQDSSKPLPRDVIFKK
jgi:hypothetical protein